MTLYQELKSAGIPIDCHESDLYFLVSKESKAILDRFPENKKSARPFLSNLDGRIWMDCPFAFDPFWEKKLSKKEIES